MKHNTEYDMPFEAIQAAIMENMPKNILQMDEKMYSARGDSSVTITPYVRPAPEKLFQLSEEDKLEFEKLRKTLSSYPDKENPNEEIPSLHRPLFKQTKLQPQSSRLLSAKTYRNGIFSKYMPNETILFKQSDKKMNELDDFLETYEVPEAQMESIFHLTNEEIQAAVPQHEQDVINFLQRISEKYKQLRLQTESNIENLQSLDKPEIIIRAERKTAYCDLRNSAVLSNSTQSSTTMKTNRDTRLNQNQDNSSSDSASEQDDGLWFERFRNFRQRQKRITLKDHTLSKAPENCSTKSCDVSSTNKTKEFCKMRYFERSECSDILLERRRNYCMDLLQSNGFKGCKEVLLHEEVSFTPAIPLVPSSLNKDCTTTRDIHLALQCQKFGTYVDYQNSNRQRGAYFKLTELEQHTYTLFAIFSWLISSVIDSVPPELGDRSKSQINLKTVGLLRLADSLNRNDVNEIHLIDEPQLHVLLKFNIMKNNSEFTTDDEVEKYLNQTCLDVIQNWSMDENLVHTSTLHYFNEMELLWEEDTKFFSIQPHKHTLWSQTSDTDLPSCLRGIISSTGESRWFDEAGACSCPTSARSPNRANCANPCLSKDNNQDEHKYSEILIEVNMVKLPVDKVKSIIFALLFNLYHLGLDLIGLRLGWIDNSSPSSSNQLENVEQPILALAFRGPNAWDYGKTICAWIISRVTGLAPETIRCFGNRCKDVTLKYMTRWFGPRFPDVAKLSPVKIARAKHQTASLLAHQQHPYWLVHSEPSDLVLEIPVSDFVVFSTVIRIAIDNCGYQLYYLGISKRKSCERDSPEHEMSFVYRTIRLERSGLCQESTEKHNNDNVNYVFLLVLRRENCIAHLNRLIKMLKEAINHEQKSKARSEQLNGSQLTINITPYNDNVRTAFDMDKLLQLPNPADLHSIRLISENSNLCPPTQDCPSLGLIVIRSCAINNSSMNASYGHRPGRGGLSTPATQIFYQILDHLADVSQVSSVDTELRILGVKWLPICCVTPKIREIIEKYSAPHEQLSAEFNELRRCHGSECAIGMVLLLGSSLQSLMQTWNNSRHAVLVTNLESVRYLAELFFNADELFCLDLAKRWVHDVADVWSTTVVHDNSSQASIAIDQSKQFPIVWNMILQSIQQSWIPQQIIFAIPWFKNLAASDWLTDFITLVDKFTNDGFVIESCFTNSDGRTLCCVSRPNGIRRLRQLTNSSLAAENSTGLTTQTNHDNLTHVELRQLISSPIPNSQEMQDQVAGFKQKLMNLDWQTTECNNVGRESFEIYDDILDEWSSHFKELNLLAIRFNHWPNCESQTITKEQQTTKEQCVRDLMQICKLLKESYYIIAGIRYGFLNETQITLTSQVVNLTGFQSTQKIEPGQYALLAIVGTLGCAPLASFLGVDPIDKYGFAERVQVFVGDPMKVVHTIFGVMGPFLMPYCRGNH